MAITWHTLRDGVRYYEHNLETVPHPDDRRKRRPMRLYYLKYRYGDKVYNEAVGSEKLYSEAEVIALADELKSNRKKGTPPFTLAEKRKASNEAYEAQREEEVQKELHVYDTFFEQVFIPAKEHLKNEDRIGEKHLRYLKGMHERYVRPIMGELTFDKITEEHFRSIVAAMRGPVEKTRKVRDYEKEAEVLAAAGGKFVRKKRYYKEIVTTEPALSMKTVQSVKAMCHEVWKMAVKKRIAHVDFPGEEIAKGTLNNGRTRFFTADEIEMILDDLKRRSIDVYHYATIAAYSGLRIGSILDLTWGALRDRVVRDTKNRANVSASIFKAVKRLDDVIREREAMFPDRKPSDPIFPCRGINKKGATPTGGKRGYMTKTFNRCLEDLKFNADIDDPRARACFHTLRHSYASILVQKGMTIEKVAELMGHKTLQMTQRYSHLGESHIAEAASILNDL